MGWGPAAPDMTAANIAAASQAKIAGEQWETTKAYLPRAMALADAENARAEKAANQSTEDSTFYRGIAQHQLDQAAKAEPFQQKFRDTATAYSDGTVGNAEAGRAGADVEQAFDNATGSMTRSASRMGLNPGSGAFAASLGDMYTQKALAGAGAQTNARLGARDKAEALVAAAAGSGQTSFSNGMGAGGAAGGFNAGSVALGSAGLSAQNSAMGVYNAGASGASGGYGMASSNLRANAIESAKTPGFDFVAGLATGGLKAAGAAGGFGKLFSSSDRRLKTSIRRVGTLDNGLAVYTFRYKSGGPTVMGVMADEVEQVLPHAVAKRAIDGEFDAVNYAAL